MAGDFPNLDLTTILHWHEPNLLDPPRRPWFPIYSIILTVLTALLLGGRIWAQARKSIDGVRLDDVLACSAWLFSVLYTVSCIRGTLKYGFDRHIWDTPSDLLGHAALAQWLGEIAFTISTALSKVSVLCFYQRLEPLPTRAFRILIHIAMGLVVCYSIACIIVQLLLCRPLTAYWEIAKPTASTQERACSSQRIFYLLQGTIGSATSFYCIAIPFAVLRYRPMSWTQRCSLNVISIAAISVVATGAIRTVMLHRLTEDINADATWNGFNVFVCAQLECQLIIIFASLPFLRRYFVQDPTLPVVFHPEPGKLDLAASRVSSSLRRLPWLGSSDSQHELELATPKIQLIDFSRRGSETVDSPWSIGTPAEEITYEKYLSGRFGPPAPPKDNHPLD